MPLVHSTDLEWNYCTTRSELLAVVYFLKYFRCYLLGRQFLVCSDHSALRFLQNTPEPMGQQARWLEVLQEYTFELQHRPGRNHGNADALSRRGPCKQCGLDVLPEDSANILRLSVADEVSSKDDLVTTLDADRLRIATAADPDLSEFLRLRQESIQQVEWESIVAKSPLVKILWTQWDRLEVREDLLYRHWYNSDGFHDYWQVVVPASLQKDVLKLTHKGMRAHYGLERTKQQLNRRAYWPGWAHDAESFVFACPDCSRFKQGKSQRQGEMQDMRVGAPMERVSIDLTGPHVKSSKGNVYCLTIIDYFTRWAESYPLRNKEASTVAKVLVD